MPKFGTVFQRRIARLPSPSMAERRAREEKKKKRNGNKPSSCVSLFWEEGRRKKRGEGRHVKGREGGERKRERDERDGCKENKKGDDDDKSLKEIKRFVVVWLWM